MAWPEAPSAPTSRPPAGVTSAPSTQARSSEPFASRRSACHSPTPSGAASAPLAKACGRPTFPTELQTDQAALVAFTPKTTPWLSMSARMRRPSTADAFASGSMTETARLALTVSRWPTRLWGLTSPPQPMGLTGVIWRITTPRRGSPLSTHSKAPLWSQKRSASAGGAQASKSSASHAGNCEAWDAGGGGADGAPLEPAASSVVTV